MIDNQLIINRIDIFIEQKKISVSEFEKICGFNADLRVAKSRKSGLGTDKIVTIVTKFPELNSKWLLTGEGEMIIETAQPAEEITAKEDKTAYLLKLLKEKDERINDLKETIEILKSQKNNQ